MAITRATERKLSVLRRLRGSVHHHRHIDIIERPEPDKFLLAGHETQFAVLVHLPAVLHVNKFLCRQGHQSHVAGQRLVPFEHFETDRRPEHHADLAVVATGVCRPGVRIGMRVTGHAKRIQFADDGNGRARLTASNITLHTGQRDAGFVRDIEFTQLLAHVTRSVHL